MTDAMRLAAYAVAVVAVTLVHEPVWLAGALMIAIVVSGQGRVVLLRRALRVVVPVALMISCGMLLAGWLQGSIGWHALALLNMRVVLLSVLVTWMVRDVDLDRALARWPDARRWLAIVRMHITSMQQQVVDYKAAFASRSAEPPTLVSRYRAVSSHGLGLLDKAVHNAEASTLGMRSRGALDEPRNPG